MFLTLFGVILTPILLWGQDDPNWLIILKGIAIFLENSYSRDASPWLIFL